MMRAMQGRAAAKNFALSQRPKQGLGEPSLGETRNASLLVRAPGRVGSPHGQKTQTSFPRSLTARWMDWNASCRKSFLQRNVSDPLEVKNLASISFVMRMTSSSPVNRKNYWKEKSSPSSSNSCENEVSNSLRPRPSLRTWSTALIFSDKTCADTLTGNCSSSLPRRMLEPS